MLTFDKPFKLYLFKNRKQVEWSMHVAENYVHTYTLAQDIFERILDEYRNPMGFKHQLQVGVHWTVEHKTVGPRPECQPVDYVRITIYNQNMAHNYRFDLEDMLNLERDYIRQLNNKMHWD
ncbi:hypothetical protein UFOVP190_171 [uncultured Caudovirales phage]|jgi:hypothetical protein|uniref:Uncharacterized protein n=1 Tax=uncultured Caudovirales phage TaxID=2100421 RepID=A0A6J7WGP0_9CAUD|nr:hypothetical protein UFOVP190_171 [uncultured Caudovirales phage]